MFSPNTGKDSGITRSARAGSEFYSSTHGSICRSSLICTSAADILQQNQLTQKRKKKKKNHHEAFWNSDTLSDNNLSVSTEPKHAHTAACSLAGNTPFTHTHAQANIAASGATCTSREWLKYVKTSTSYIPKHDSLVKPLITELLLWQHLSSYHAYFIVWKQGIHLSTFQFD